MTSNDNDKVNDKVSDKPIVEVGDTTQPDADKQSPGFVAKKTIRPEGHKPIYKQVRIDGEGKTKNGLEDEGKGSTDK